MDEMVHKVHNNIVDFQTDVIKKLDVNKDNKFSVLRESKESINSNPNDAD